MNTYPLSLAGATVLAAAWAASPAMAQTTASETTVGTLEEIVVTALRREQSLQDVPASISVVDGQALANAGALASQDIAQLAPNVQWETTSISNPRIFIRGIGSLEFNANGSGSVGIYVDDIFIGSLSALNFLLLDTQRVEVLRGPQGTLYGRNNTGGAINYISRQPTDELNAGLSVRMGNYSLRAAEGALSGPLGGGFSGRLAGKFLKRDGVTTNVANPSDEWGNLDQWALRGSLKYDGDGIFDASLTVSAGKADQSSLSYQALGVYDPDAFALGQLVRCSDARILANVCVNSAGLTDADRDVRRAAYDAMPHYDRVETVLSSLKLNWDLGFADLTSISGFLTAERDEWQDTDATPVVLLHNRYTNESEQFTQEFRLTSPGGQTFNWIAGLYYLQDDVDADNRYVTPAFPGGHATQTYTQETTAWAVFARGDVRLLPKLTATLGVRYTDEEKEFSTVNGFAATGPVLILTRKPSHTRFSGDFVLDYAFNDDVRLYGSVARGFKAGGVNGGVVFNPLQVTSFNPELVTAYEVGTKTRLLDGAATLNAAAFFYDYTDLQMLVTRDLGSGVPTPVIDNAGAAEVLGLEIEGTWAVSDALRINAALGLLDTKFTKYVDFGGANHTGNQLPSAPKTSFTFGFDYTRPIGAGLVLALGGNTSHRSHSFFSPENSVLTDRDASWVTNAHIGVQQDKGRWSLTLWGRNLGDEEVRVGYANLDSFGYKLHSYEDPRTYGIEATVSF